MKSITKLAACLIFVLMLASFAQAQKAKTIKGYLCSSSEGMNGGAIGLRVSTKVVLIGHTFSVSPGDTAGMTERQAQKYIGEHTTKEFGMEKQGSREIGAEYVIVYKTVDGRNWAYSITFTGKTKRIKPCS